MKRHLWKVADINLRALEIAKQRSLSVFIVQTLLNRGLKQDEFDEFLNPTRAHFLPPFLLPDIDKAVERIRRAATSREKVLVFGDYDVDGITALAIFYEFTKQFPGVFSFYIPHRIQEGYGLNSEAILRAKDDEVSLIIAFDCGTNAQSEIELASSLGIDVIVIDHHHTTTETIHPFAFINPQRADSLYPFADLSAAALSFKLLQALSRAPCYEVLDLLALSLVCDVVPLRGENRALLNEGLEAIRESKRFAIKALCKVSGIKQKNIDTFHIGYILGPRINASGRVAHADDSLRLFLAESLEEAESLAAQLGEYNILRRNIEAQILKEAEQKINENISGDNTIVVSGEQWHPGVLGIVASRLTDKYCRPSFVISFDEGKGVGSGRSIEGVHLIKMLEQCADSLLMYGGHKKAAGVHINKDELENFKEKINGLLEETVRPEDFIPLLAIDAVMGFENITLELAQQIEMLKPHGEDNPKPVFVAYNIRKKNGPKRINIGYSLWLTDGNKTFEAIVYDKELLDIIEYADSLDIAFSLQLNTYHNSPRISIRDCRLSEAN